VERTGENCLVPGQDYMQGVAVPPNALPPMFLLSQQQCADARCSRGDRCFWLMDSSFWTKDWLYSFF